MYKELKAELKTLSKEITTLKSQRKSSPNGYVSGLDNKRYIARHKHIAYCLLRGREYEQIERTCYEEPDMSYVERIMEAHNETVCAE